VEKFGKIFLLPRDIGPSQTFILVEGLGKLARIGELRELFRPWEWGTPGLRLQGCRELMAYMGLLSLEACSPDCGQCNIRWLLGVSLYGARLGSAKQVLLNKWRRSPCNIENPDYLSPLHQQR